MDRAASPALPAGDKPRPWVSRLLSTLFCVAIVSAFILAGYRRNMDLYPFEGGVFLALFLLGCAAGIVNRRVYGIWI